MEVSAEDSIWPRWLSLIVAGLSAAVLIVGWGAGVDAFTRIRPDFAAMVPSTTICFMLLSAGILALATERDRTWPRLCAGLAGGISAINLILASFPIGVQLDNLIVASMAEDDGMAFATSASVLLAAYSLFALTLKDGDAPAFQWTATLGLLAALVALVGYAFDTRALYDVFVFTAMALHTAVLFVFVFAAILLLAPGQSWVAILVGRGPGSVGARRLLPLVALAPVALCFVALQLTDVGLFNANFRLSLLAIVMMAIATWAVLRNGRLMNEADRDRTQLVQDLRQTSAERALLLKELYHRVKNNLQQINAMLRIEARKFDDPRLTESFRAVSDRVAALGTVHQLLISAPTPSEVEVKEFLEVLCNGVAVSNSLERRGIELVVEADPGRAHIEVAISMGLLVNELVTNAIKHAFGEGPGKIVVTYETRPDCLMLVVSDTGAGTSDPAHVFASKGTGSLIIQSMVSQLKADMQVRNSGGLVVEVRIPPNINEVDRYE